MTRHMIVRIAFYQGRVWFLCRCGEPCEAHELWDES